MSERASGRTPELREVIAAAESLWPAASAEDWDVVGLTVGDPAQRIGRVLFAVDPVAETIEEARGLGADLLFTHHPLMLRGVNSVAMTTPKGDAVHRLISAGVALFTAHTNADGAIGGVSDALIEALGVDDARPLDAPDAAEPQFGTGRVGDLPSPMRLSEFAARVAAALPATSAGIRVSGPADAEVRRVAVCGGAGDGYFALVRQSGADVYVTADLRHHPASEAREAGPGISLVDVSHWASESLWLPRAAEQLRSVLKARGATVETDVSTVVTDPWASQLPTSQLPDSQLPTGK